MPTVGWIQETAIDRYWERGEIGTQYPPMPVRHYCPYCLGDFKSTSELSAHISVEHPVERPLMFLNGREALSEQTIRVPLRSNSIELANVTSLRVSKDGGLSEDWPASKLMQHFSSHEQAHYAVTLRNVDPEGTRPVEASYVVRIKIADEKQVASVDKSFIQMLAVDDVRMSDIRRFSETCAVYRDADEYASALAVYVTGVLIKDQTKSTGMTRPFAEYADKMQQAFDVLREYARPVPATICAAIRLNLNDFRSPPIPCGVEPLDRINEFFWLLGSGTNDLCPEHFVRAADAGKRPLCPIDRTTHELLHTYQQVAARLPRAPSFEDLARGPATRSLADYDRMKFNALIAAASLRAGKRETALPLLEDLVNDPVFGKWAEHRLESESE